MADPNTEFDRLVAAAEEPETVKPDARVLEETLLVGLFTSAEAAARILGETRPTDFYFERHRRLAQLVFPALGEGRHIDRVTLNAALPEAKDEAGAAERDALLTFADEVFEKAKTAPPSLGKVEAYLTIFMETARLRLAKSLVRKAGEELDAGETSPTEAASRVFEVVADLEASRRLVGSFRSEAEAWPAYFAALEAKQAKTEYLGMNSGFDHLNNVCNGLPEGLFVLGAKTSLGKTTFAKQLLDQVALLNPKAACLFVSLEQSAEELRVKTLSRLSGIENRDILRGRLDVNSPGWARVREAGETYRKETAGRVFILEGGRETTPDRIRLAALQVRRATQAEALLLVVDYLQIVPTEQEYRDPRNRLDAVTSDLRRIARDLGASVLAVSSVGRSDYEKPGVSSFKESGGIEYGADIAAVLTRDPDKDAGTELYEGIHRNWKRVYLDVVKQRNGERARISFRFFPEVSYFHETDKETLPEDDPNA